MREYGAAGHRRLQLERVPDQLHAGHEPRCGSTASASPPPLEDPTKSRIVGKVGYGVMPPGPKAQHSAMLRRRHGHLGRRARRRAPPGSTCQWATSKADQARMLAGGCRRAGAQLGVYTDREVDRRPASRRRSGSIRDAEPARSRRPGLPVIVPVTEFRDIFGIALTNMITGADPATELKKATGAVPAGAREEREGLSCACGADAATRRGRCRRTPAAAAPNYRARATGCSRCRRWSWCSR